MSDDRARHVTAFFHNDHTMMVVLDPESGVIVEANPAASAFYGLPQERLAGMRLWDLCAVRGERERTLERIALALRGSERVFLGRHVRGDGDERDIEVRLGPILLDSRAFMLAVLLDVSERERAARTLRANEERYRRLVEVTPDAMFVEQDRKLVYVNPATVAFFGETSAEGLLGRDILELLHPDYHEVVLARIEAVEKRGLTVPLIEERYIRTDGAIVDAEVAATPIEYQGKMAVQVMARDISHRKELEQAKDDFLAMVSHELRTPLTSMLGFATLLERAEVAGAPERVVEVAGSIRQRGEDMAGLVEELLQVSQLASPGFGLRKQRVDFGDLIDRCVGSLSIEDRGRVRARLEPGLGAVECDSTRMSMVVRNLLGNALKFSLDGGDVVLTASKSDREVSVSVSDDGIGIAPEDLGHVFDRFWQADMSSTRSFPGVGLGLFITKRVVEDHGGTIEVASVPGGGSTFTIRIPVTAEAEA